MFLIDVLLFLRRFYRGVVIIFDIKFNVFSLVI